MSSFWFGLGLALMLGALSVSAKDYSQAADAMRERLETQGARWKLVQTIQGWTFEVHVTSLGSMRQLSLSAMPPGLPPKRAWTVVERDGYWYVTDEDRRKRRYRAYEAVFTQPIAYLLIHRADPKLVESTEMEPSRQINGRDYYLSQLDQQTANQLRATMQNSERLLAQIQGQDAEQLRAKVGHLKRLIKEGVEFVIDADTGMIVKDGIMEHEHEIRDFSFLDRAGNYERLFNVNPKDYEDLAGPKDYQNLAATWYFPHQDPAAIAKFKGGYESVLLDYKRDQITRVPFVGFEMSPAVFAPDRKTVYVSGIGDGMAFQVFEISLVNGTQRPIDFPEFSGGVVMVGNVSPSGRRLQVTCLRPLSMTIDSIGFDHYFVDLKLNKLFQIGGKMDASDFNWLEDESGLVFEQRFPQKDSDYSRSMIARADLKGTVKVLFEGDNPVLLDGDKILFQKDQLWHTGKLDGSGISKFHDGLPDMLFPSYRTGSKFLLANKRDPANGNPLQFVDLKTGVSLPASAQSGVWVMPHL